MTDINRNWMYVTINELTFLGCTNGVQNEAGQIYISTDSGVTWRARMTDVNRNWNGIATSSDGTNIVAIVNGGNIYISTPTPLINILDIGTLYQPYSMSNQISTSSSYTIDYTNDSTLFMYYKLDDSNNNYILNNATNQYDSYLFNGATISTNSYVGTGSLLLNGNNQYLSIGSFIVSSSSGLSFSFWFKANTSGMYSRFFEFGNGNGGQSNTIYLSIYDTTRMQYRINGSQEIVTVTTSTITNINNNTWYHCVWILPPTGNGNIYMNGVLANTSNFGVPATNIDRNINSLGKSNWGDPYFIGQIDDFRGYSKVLSYQDVIYLYNINSSPTISNFIAPNNTITTTNSTIDRSIIDYTQYKYLTSTSTGATTGTATINVNRDSTINILAIGGGGAGGIGRGGGGGAGGFVETSYNLVKGTTVVITMSVGNGGANGTSLSFGNYGYNTTVSFNDGTTITTITAYGGGGGGIEGSSASLQMNGGSGGGAGGRTGNNVGLGNKITNTAISITTSTVIPLMIDNYVPILNQSTTTVISNSTYSLQNGDYIISSSGNDYGTRFYNYQAFAFTTGNANYWAANARNSTTVVNGSTIKGEWLQIQIPNDLLMTSFTTCNVYNVANAILIAGSNNGTTWDLVYNITNTGLTNTNSDAIFGPPVIYNMNGNSNYYNYFRFIITNTNGQSNLGKVNFSGYVNNTTIVAQGYNGKYVTDYYGGNGGGAGSSGSNNGRRPSLPGFNNTVYYAGGGGGSGDNGGGNGQGGLGGGGRGHYPNVYNADSGTANTGGGGGGAYSGTGTSGGSGIVILSSMEF